jgi:exodeoxyribonuclease-3
MKIISYNVNGIRAALKKGFLDWLQVANPDVICIQETKAHKEQLDLAEFEKAGYPHHYWFSAQKKGYSSVAVFCKEKPNHIAGIETMDFEGRNLRVDFSATADREAVSIMSLYLPSGTNLERLNFKLNYMDEFQEYINTLKKEIPNLVICGDYNICHEAIDIHNPKMKGVSGFLPEERTWMGAFINNGFIDSFRFLNQEKQEYSWWSYRANSRANNKGWRLDYAMVSESLKDKITRAYILSEAKHSDHCPIVVELDI